jgi:hypothetical protein
MYQDKLAGDWQTLNLHINHSTSQSGLNSTGWASEQCDDETARSQNSRLYQEPFAIHPMSHSTSLSTVALSSSSCNSLSSSSSSTYSLSTINSDIELGNFINDDLPRPSNSSGHTHYHSPDISASLSRNAYYYFKPCSKPYWHAVKTRATRRFQRCIKNMSLVTLWQCVVYAIFSFYLWVLVCTFTGDTRVIKTCPSLPDLATNTELATHKFTAPVLESLTLVPSSVIHGEQASHMEYVAREHILPPTSPPFLV